MSHLHELKTEYGLHSNEEVPEPLLDTTEKLFGQSFEIRSIENGQAIPVGGNSILSNQVDRTVIGDFEHFSELLEEVRQDAHRQDTPQLKEWIEVKGYAIESKTLAALIALTKKLGENYRRTVNSSNVREEIYGKTADVKISDVFGKGAQECVEIAALAQYFLQEMGIASSFFSGEVLWRDDYEFGDKHSFIVIRNNEKQFVFDPANPTKATNGLHPSVYLLSADFDSEVRKGQKRFIAGTNILTNQKAFYGVGDGTNISPEDLVTA